MTTDDEARRATTDALVSRGATRRCLDAMSTDQLKRLAETVVALDAEGKKVTWTKGLDA